MNCDNCGAEIDKDEEYCPNCGMQLFDLPPNPIKKKANKSSESSSVENSGDYEKSDSLTKPIKQRYIDHLEPESPDYSHYDQEYEEEYETPPKYEEEVQETEDMSEGEKKESSGSGMVNIILFLLIALILGFIAGILMFSSQTIKIPGLNF